MRYSLFLRLFRSLCVVAAAAALTFVGCTEVDDTLGSDYIPGNQQLKIGYRAVDGCFETRLYRTDSLRTSNIEVGVLGSTRSDTFGLRSAGFYTQYTWGICPDSTEGFGYRPIFDSLMMGFSITAFKGDSTLVREYEVYEVVDDSFLAKQSDTLFYGTFDMTPYLSSEPAFTFRFPDPKRGIYPSSTAVKLEPTATGLDLVERLMLRKGPYAENNMEGFFDGEQFGSHFKGLYFKPKADAQNPSESSLIEFKLSESGMILYGRNRNRIDPTLIQDTTASLYYFLDKYADAGKASINTLRRDYAGSLLEGLEFEEQAQERSLTEVCYVEGLGGVITEITFTDELFNSLEQILESERDEAGNPYSSLAINRAHLCLFDSEADYNWEQLTPSEALIARWDASMERLGLYTDFKTLSGITDYNYAYEVYYEVELPYDGHLNRSRGCYVMDIASHLQQLWNSYLNNPEKVMGNASTRSLYLGPEAYSINTFDYATGQGMASSPNRQNAMRIELTYTLIK